MSRLRSRTFASSGRCWRLKVKHEW
eukprot:jgi/Mesen1/8385/ME000468S07819